MTADLPTGTVTFLFSDIEGSTRLLQELGDRYAALLEEQRRLLRSAFNAAGGTEVSTQGDGFFVVFPDARDALAAAIEAQRAVARHQWPEGAAVRVRMGIHTGGGVVSGGDYVGLDVHRAARIASVGHGGQVLLSEATRVLAGEDLLPGVVLEDLGRHRLKDLQRPEHLFQALHAGGPTAFPPLQSLEAFPHNLPVQLTSFIGRETEMAEVKRLLADARLVTLRGAGGAGKTRLALQVAAESLDGFPDGVWFVELAPITDAGLVPQTVASTLAIQEPSRPAVERLVAFLRYRTLLLMLDNCEHLTAASAQLSADLLRQCPQLRILATSREALGVLGETIYPVPPLALPSDDHTPSINILAQSPAVRLFVDRATRFQPGFALTEQTTRAVAEICRRLDGIPLAIELAAAKVNVLTVEQIAARLDDRFRLLGGGLHGVLPHHQTLHTTITWSHDLLDEAERTMFRRIAVFVGGFTLDAAEAVCADALAPADVLDLLSRLVDKSLVVLEHGPTEDARYGQLETIRQYGDDRLAEAGEVQGLRDRHLDYYAALAERAETRLHGPEQRAWLDRLDAEHDNFRAALEWCRARRDVEQGLKLAGSLWWFWEVRGHWTEGSEWLQEFLKEPPTPLLAPRVKALNAAGWLALRAGDFARTVALTEESLALSRELGDKRATASCLVILGIQACAIGDYRRAEALGGESLTLAREVQDNWGTALAQMILGLVARADGNHGRAQEQLTETLSRMRALGHPWGTANVLANLGFLMGDQGEHGQARALLEEALALFRQLGDRSFIAYTQLTLGAMTSVLGDFADAEGRYRESLTLRRELQDRRGVATCLAALGCTAAGLGRYARAARLFGVAEARREATGATIPPFIAGEYEKKVSATAEALGDAAFRSEWLLGKSMTPEAMMDFALGDAKE